MDAIAKQHSCIKNRNAANKLGMKPHITSGESKFSLFMRGLKRDKYLLLLILPGFLYYIIFRYIPMTGIIIGFKDYNAYRGIWASPWNNFQHFKDFFGDIMFLRLFRNTLLLGLYSILWGFPAPIIFALLLNEVKNTKFKRTVQTISYMPHFISTVIIVGMILSFLSPTTGIVNRIITAMGGDPIHFMVKSEWFRTIYISSGIWQGTGWGAIIYLAAISNINEELYEAARIDGAKRFKQAIYITLPSITPTIVILFILNVGGILDNDFQKVLLMQNAAIYETADVIQTYVYRRGIISADFSFATAVDISRSIIALGLVSLTNFISSKVSDVSLW